jgi:diguanylate cyclase (GGDEF)-like protein
MEGLNQAVLLEALADCGEPLLLVHLNVPDWPIVFSNRAFDMLSPEIAPNEALGSALDTLFGRETAVEVSDAVHSRTGLKFAVQLKGRECLLDLQFPGGDESSICALYFRGVNVVPLADADPQKALLRAKRKLKDLSREDLATGLLNKRAFHDVFTHDWAVANRENTALSLIVVQLDDVGIYLTTFGPHALDSCLRRVGQCLRRKLRRASDLMAHTGNGQFVILSHASDEPGVSDFATKLTADIRALGIHHPKSSVAKFVTASCRVVVVTPSGAGDANAFFEETLGA